MNYSFDAETHSYKIGNRHVPSVTQVLADLIPGWKASDWYLERGRAVHACAALLANGLEFEHDPRIDGQVRACRKFLDDWKSGGYEPVATEIQVYSDRHLYAGTVDLILRSPKQFLIVDYKTTLTDSVPIQLGAYANAIEANGATVKFGMGVQLNEDGTYKCSKRYDLRRYRNEFLALLTAYNIRRRMKIRENSTDE